MRERMLGDQHGRVPNAVVIEAETPHAFGIVDASSIKYYRLFEAFLEGAGGFG